MRFRTWIENEASLNSDFPEVLAPINRLPDTPASAEVKRTGLQPQVDSEEIPTDRKEIEEIDINLEKFDKNLPKGKENDQISQFKKLWHEFKTKWQKIKEKPSIEKTVNIGGLGGSTGDQKYLDLMQQHPNLIPGNSNQMPVGPSFQ